MIINGTGQSRLNNLKNRTSEPAEPPIRLKDMGSFVVGGRTCTPTGRGVKEVVLTKGGEPVKFDLDQTFHLEHMYVQYYIPEETQGDVPLLLWHGGGLTGSCFESTPDGRSGWVNRFLQHGWTVYNSDSVERGRAGWMPYVEPYSKEPVLFPEYYPFEVWRLGKGRFNIGDWEFYEDTQFPKEHYEGLVKKLVPCWADSYDATLNAYKELVEGESGCVILAHSQGARYAFQVAEEFPDKVKAIVAIEPGSCGEVTQAQNLKDVPVLTLYGDFVEGSPRWTTICQRNETYFERIREAGGTADVIHLPEIGIIGNSHLMMMDSNHMEIADLIQDWLKRVAI